MLADNTVATNINFYIVALVLLYKKVWNDMWMKKVYRIMSLNCITQNRKTELSFLG